MLSRSIDRMGEARGASAHGLPLTTTSFTALRSHLERAREAPEEFFQNGLEKAENDRLMTTVDPLEASRLVLKGLNQFNKWRAD